MSKASAKHGVCRKLYLEGFVDDAGGQMKKEKKGKGCG